MAREQCTTALATADDPAHALHRQMLVPQLAARRIRDLETFVETTMGALWRQVPRGRPVEWMAAVANRIWAWAYASTQVLQGRVDEPTLAGAGTALIGSATRRAGAA
ncbi:hypothetical protein ACTWP6_26925 [Mycobacterium sp. 4D054]|uniref:hypothetical protein n=1 Tax=Mycobacterium sp. 4D054 TaxID=3457440 RepID=UPI003FD339E4